MTIDTAISRSLVQKNTRAFQGMPSGLSHYDQALYLWLGRKLEREAQSKPLPWALDFGTYFGHSALTLRMGAALFSRDPKLKVLTLDIFDQPEWLFNQPDVKRFVSAYGEVSRDSIDKWLQDASKACALPGNNIVVRKQDVTTLEADQLADIAPQGYSLVAVDCGKTPALMNQILRLTFDPKVTSQGALIAFQDLFDWHSPWNAYVFSRLLRQGHVRLKYFTKSVAPLLEVLRHSGELPLCKEDLTSPIGAQWCQPYADLQDELDGLQETAALLHKLGDHAGSNRVEALSIGTYLRANQPDSAERRLAELDLRWPLTQRDATLQDAYRRIQHYKTGKKDLTLFYDTARTRRRATPLLRFVQKTKLRIASRFGFQLAPAGSQ